MKRMKKLASILLAAIMVLAMAVPAMAETKVTLDDTKGLLANHTFTAYQIFKGTQAKTVDGDLTGPLGDIQWGDGIKSTDFLAALSEKYADKFNKDMSASDVAAKIAEVGKNEDDALAIGELAQKYIEDGAGKVIFGTGVDDGALVAGYYVIVDTTANLNDGEKTVVNTSLLQVTGVGNITIKLKTDIPTVDKQVQDDEGDAENGAVDGWAETADHQINESFQFKLTANVPKDVNFPVYDKYAVKFNDTMSQGITYESIVSVKVDNVVLTPDQYTLSGIPVEPGANMAGLTWGLAIEDIKSIKGVTLEDGVVIEVIYSAHLNEAAAVGNEDDNQNTVGLDYSNNPNGEGMGKTEEDTVYVFTYEVPNTKYANEIGEGHELAGAEFTLYKDSVVSGNEVKLVLKDGVYYPALEDDGTAVTVMTSQVNTGKFDIKGLDVGTYILKETKTPAGYNTCADVTIVIQKDTEAANEHNETGANMGAETHVVMTVNGTKATKNDVINKSGTTLPETGGIGTTIFYVLGSILVVGAVILLVTKKRMSVEK